MDNTQRKRKLSWLHQLRYDLIEEEMKEKVQKQCRKERKKDATSKKPPKKAQSMICEDSTMLPVDRKKKGKVITDATLKNDAAMRLISRKKAVVSVSRNSLAEAVIAQDKKAVAVVSSTAETVVKRKVYAAPVTQSDVSQKQELMDAPIPRRAVSTNIGAHIEAPIPRKSMKAIPTAAIRNDAVDIFAPPKPTTEAAAIVTESSTMPQTMATISRTAPMGTDASKDAIFVTARAPQNTTVSKAGDNRASSLSSRNYFSSLPDNCVKRDCKDVESNIFSEKALMDHKRPQKAPNVVAKHTNAESTIFSIPKKSISLPLPTPEISASRIQFRHEPLRRPRSILDRESQPFLTIAMQTSSFYTAAQSSSPPHSSLNYGTQLAESRMHCDSQPSLSAMLHQSKITPTSPSPVYFPLTFTSRIRRENFQRLLYGSVFTPQILRQRTTVIARDIRFQRKSVGICFNSQRDKDELMLELRTRFQVDACAPRVDIPAKSWNQMLRQDTARVYLHFRDKESADSACERMRDDLNQHLCHLDKRDDIRVQKNEENAGYRRNIHKRENSGGWGRERGRNEKWRDWRNGGREEGFHPKRYNEFVRKERYITEARDLY